MSQEVSYFRSSVWLCRGGLITGAEASRRAYTRAEFGLIRRALTPCTHVKLKLHRPKLKQMCGTFISAANAFSRAVPQRLCEYLCINVRTQMQKNDASLHLPHTSGRFIYFTYFSAAGVDRSAAKHAARALMHYNTKTDDFTGFKGD